MVYPVGLFLSKDEEEVIKQAGFLRVVRHSTQGRRRVKKFGGAHYIYIIYSCLEGWGRDINAGIELERVSGVPGTRLIFKQ